MNSVLYTVAIVQKRRNADAKHLLAQHEPTKGIRAARRVLQRHLVDVIFRAMHADQANGHTPSFDVSTPLDIEASTARSASTSPRAKTSLTSPAQTSIVSSTRSTTGPDVSSAGRHQRNDSANSVH